MTDGPKAPEDQEAADRERFAALKKKYVPTADGGVRMVATAGTELGLIVVVFTLGGWWIDKKLGTSPWLLLLGAFVGIGGGMFRLIRQFSRPKP